MAQGKLPEDLGPRYIRAMESYAPSLRQEVQACFAEYDTRKVSQSAVNTSLLLVTH